jgi:anti-sigma factor RsiW
MEEKYQGTACTQYEVMLEDFVNGELDSADAKILAEHLKDCGGCRSAFQDASACARLLRVSEPTPDPGPGFARIVMARIRAEEAASAAEGKSLWQPFVSLAWRFAATAAIGLAALMTYDLSGHAALDSITVLAQQSEARDFFSSNAVNPPRSRDDVLMLVAESNHGKQ